MAIAYDFSGLATIVDVVAATGHLLTTLLTSHPGCDGILFDLPHVVRDAPPPIEGCGLSDRITLEAGLQMSRIVLPASPVSIVEAILA